MTINELKFDKDGLIPAVVVDAITKKVLTVAYMNRESLKISLEKGLTCFWSRSRQELWLKGETSGNYQHIVRITADCDRDALTAGEGLEKCTEAFFSWVAEIKERYPGVILEGCSSGGMRMDGKTLSVYSLVSTSDQTDYLKYPYIAGNILSAAIPEQAAVWSYPVGSCKQNEINDDQIVVNMINSFLGRMHLASHLEWMDEGQLALVRQGVEVYGALTDFKKRALPILPWGFTRFGAPLVCAGLRDGDTAYLAVWCLGETMDADIPLAEEIERAQIVYPAADAAAALSVCADGKRVSVRFARTGTAVLIRVKFRASSTAT